jgi:two-component system sensor histidine kinase HydH
MTSSHESKRESEGRLVLTGLAKYKIPITVQVGVVAVLFIGALVVLWITGASVVARERRCADAKWMLEQAGDALATRGRDIIAGAGAFPSYPEEQSRDELDRTLSAQTAALLPRDQPMNGEPKPSQRRTHDA